MAGYTLNDRRFQKDVKSAEKFFKKKFPKRVYEEFKRQTPRDTGNAKRNTQLKRTNEGHAIIGDYEYSGVLDRGLYGVPPGSANGPKTRRGYSTQAPEGMSKPTVEYAEKLAEDFLRRL